MEGVAGRLLRGVRARGATSAIIVLVALVAVAAAVTGPTFATAAERAVLTDTLHEGQPLAQGVEITWQRPAAGLADVTAAVDQARQDSGTPDLLPARIRGQQTSFAPLPYQQAALAWRDGLCDHLRVVTGRCPAAAGEVVVSAATARLDGLTTKSTLAAGKVPLRVVGVYEPREPTERYWGARGYFGQVVSKLQLVDSIDAFFTAPATFEAFGDAPVGTSVYLPLVLDAVTPDRVPALRTAVPRIATSVAPSGGAVVSTLADSLDDAGSSAQVLRVPVALITLQLLVPVWLLLFLAIGDAADARAPDVALSSLRGHSRLRTLVFGLAEPVALLALALPVGLLAGWAATGVLARAALRPGTPVTLPALAVLAGAGALSAGLLAAVLAGWRAVRRPVLEQWRRTPGTRHRRGGLVDVAVLVATAAGVVELYAAGAVGSASTHVLALLVPGLVGLGVAVLATRVLPWACRRAFGPTGRRGGLGPFLAVRQVARRPAALRSVLLLSTSFALATFAIAAWTVTAANTTAVAATRTGATAVLDVAPSPGEDLGATVATLDPGGTSAMAVDVYTDFDQDGRGTVAVDTARFAAVGHWRRDFAAAPLADLLTRLRPGSPEPVRLTGDRVRVRLTGSAASNPAVLRLGLQAGRGHSITPLDVGTVPAAPAGGTVTLEAALPAGPVVLRALTVTVLDPRGGYTPLAPSDGTSDGTPQGTFTLASLETRVGSTWTPVPAGLTGGGPWRITGTPTDVSGGTVAPGAGGLRLGWHTLGGQVGPQITWTANGFPTPMPALVTGDVTAGLASSGGTVAGLDGAQLAVAPVAVTVVPGVRAGGVLVDREYARRAAFDTTFSADHQVWLAGGAVADPQAFARRLASTGVRVLGVRTTADAEGVLRRQGPALASILFVADSGVAALLATVGAIAGLHLAGRRRRYELSALAAAGCRPRTLRASLWLEQLTVLASGLLAGAAAGAVAALLALPAFPEFVELPRQPALLFTPGWGLVLLLLAGVGLATAAAALASGATLVAGVRADQLREAAP